MGQIVSGNTPYYERTFDTLPICSRLLLSASNVMASSPFRWMEEIDSMDMGAKKTLACFGVLCLASLILPIAIVETVVKGIVFLASCLFKLLGCDTSGVEYIFYENAKAVGYCLLLIGGTCLQLTCCYLDD